jgi:hypothetical protein
MTLRAEKRQATRENAPCCALAIGGTLRVQSCGCQGCHVDGMVCASTLFTSLTKIKLASRLFHFSDLGAANRLECDECQVALPRSDDGECLRFRPALSAIQPSMSYEL